MAALEAKKHMAKAKQVETEFGLFHFVVKISMAWGLVEWFVWQNEQDHALKQRCAYAFLGDAIDRAFASDALAQPDQIILDSALCDQLPPTIQWTHLDQAAGLLHAIDHHHENSLAQQNLEQNLDNRSSVRQTRQRHSNLEKNPEKSQAEAAPIPQKEMANFYPSQLLESQLRGEFRPIVTLFLGMQTLPAPQTKADPMPRLLTLLDQYGGFLCRVDRSQSANRLLIFWGAPVSYENNLERALEFCLALRRSITIPIRAGITYQIGYAGFIGAKQRGEYTCYGSHVNLAARQMFSASWNEIWLDQDTAQRVSHTFDISPIGELDFKGFVNPQPVFKLNGLREVPTEQFFNGKICGRDQELRTLQEAIEPVFDGKFAGFVAVTGEAGIGKSRLLHEIIQSTRKLRNDIDLVHCQSDEILRHSLNPFRYHLRSYFGQARTATEAKNKANFNTKLDDLLSRTPNGRESEKRPATELDRTRSALGALLDLHWANSFYEQLEPQLRYENTLIALKNFLLIRASLSPLLLLIEDAQWMDDDSLYFLQRLSRNVDTYPIVVLISSRKAVQIDTIPVQLVPINPLTMEAIQDLAKDRLNVTLPTEQAAQLVQRTEGNPLFIEQLLLYLRESDLLSQQQLAIQIPDDAQAVLVARLDRLSEEIRQVVQTAAVLGREFDVSILSRVLNDEQNIQAKVRAATEESIWYSMNELRYLFRHTLLREAAYGMQLRARLRQLHATAAAAIEALYGENLSAHYGEIAYHYEQADEIEKALDFSAKAGQIAKENYKNREALEHYERMLRYLSPDDQGIKRMAVLQQKAEVLQFIDQYEDALTSLEEAAQLGTDFSQVQDVGRISIRMGSIEVLKGEFEAAQRLLQQGISMLEKLQAHAELGLAFRELGNVWEGLGNYDQASGYYQQALESYELAQDPSGTARTLIGLGIVAWNEGAFELAEELYKQSRRIFEELGDDYNAAIASTNLANVALVRKELGDSPSLL